MVEPLVPLVPLARAEWQRAQEASAAAAVCRDNGYYADAISRAYYASATLKQSHAKRLRADYHATDTFTVDDAQDAVDHAAAFLNRIRPLLGNNPAAPPPAL